MQRIKVATILVFICFGALIVLQQKHTVRAGGQNFGNTLSTPTGLTATDSVYATKVGLHWEPVRNATLYRIFRNTTNNAGSSTDIGTTSANYFFDSSATAGQQYFYWVRAENPSATSEFSNSDAGLRAVGNNSPGAPFPPLQPPIVPTGNPITATKAYLGKALFWDEQMSSTKTVACGTCHRPAEGGSDPRTNDATRHPGFDNTFGTLDDVFGSPGVPQNGADGTYSPVQFFGMGLQVTGRKAPSYLNAGYTTDGLFWDGRARDQFRDPLTNNVLLSSFGGLESQSVFPPLAANEMGHVGRDWTGVVTRLQAAKPLALASEIPSGLSNWINGRTYPELFEESFGTPDITPARIAMAIATHERTLFTDQTPLDRWSAQLEPLTAQEESGRQLFINNNCTFCHGGALLSNFSYQNVGVRPTTEDRGRGAITGIPDDDGRFKTPNLRNLELRGPFMHNGRFATVEEVVEFYNRGGDFDAPNVDTRIRPLNLTTQQKAALVAFLKRPLTDQRVANELPPFDRPRLYTESKFVPTITGTGRPGTGSIVPEAIAIEPPLLGNPSFAVAVSDGPAGQQAVLVIDSSDPGMGSSIPTGGSFARFVTTLAGNGSIGYGTAVLSIPNDPLLSGRIFFGRWYVNDPAAANGFSVSKLIQFTMFGGTAVIDNEAPFDFDRDGKTDVSIFRPVGGEWWWRRSSDGQVAALQFGVSTDVIAPGDFTGDGKLDHVVWRPSDGFWHVLRSEDFSYYGGPFGVAGDVPVTGDYDGDGRADVAVFRPSVGTWYIARSSDGGTTTTSFGVAGDAPVTADYDGDGRDDIGIYRPSVGQWWINRSTAGILAIQFGSATDWTVPGDYTGDGKADIAFWRPSTGEWYIVRSEDASYYAFPFGAPGDFPAPGDYDGDGKIDAAVFRNGTWFINGSTTGTQIIGFGVPGDRPVPNSFVR